MIPQSFIQDLLNRVDIVAVIERYVPLKRAGANYLACCPFHTEKSPSFTVSPSKQFYHCFGCGAHGTAIGFMIEYAGSGFIDAVTDLAQTVGMQVPEIRAEHRAGRSEQGEDLYSVMLKAAQYYRQQLKNAPRAIDYLKKRGLSGEVAQRFGIGYAPEGWQNLRAAFPDYEAQTLVDCGLAVKGDNDKRYDRFRDRIIFPIVDQRGHIVGFGGRVIDQGEPKYLNSPDTALFAKGRELYGLYQGRKAIRDRGQALVVEGYIDVVALAQYGICYAVATLGTATTPTHVQKLLRQAEHVVFCFDGDAAGRRAAWRALENSLEELVDGKQLSFLFLPEGEDPDTYVRKLGKDAFEKLIGEAEPLSRFLLRELSSRGDLRAAEGRAKLLKEAEPLVKKIAAPNLNLMLREELAQLAKIERRELDLHYGLKPKAFGRIAPRKASSASRSSLVRRMIETLLLEPRLVTHANAENLADAVEQVGINIDPDELRALAKVVEVLSGEQKVVSFTEYFRGTDYAELFAQIEQGLFRREELGLDSAELEQEFIDGWNKLVIDIKKDRERLAQRMGSAMSSQSLQRVRDNG